MRIGGVSNTTSCEYEMQDKMEEWLLSKNLRFVRELYVHNEDLKMKKAISRYADFLVLNKEGRLINIEAKCSDNITLIQQLNDHAYYCDYSFVLMPDFSLIPNRFKHELSKRKYGFIVYNYKEKIITEAIEAHYNKPIMKKFKKEIIREIKNQ